MFKTNMNTFMNEWVQEHEKSHINDQKRDDTNDEDNDKSYSRRIPRLILAFATRTKLFGLVLDVMIELWQNNIITIAPTWRNIPDI